jgi:hypothetical protein
MSHRHLKIDMSPILSNFLASLLSLSVSQGFTTKFKGSSRRGGGKGRRELRKRTIRELHPSHENTASLL